MLTKAKRRVFFYASISFFFIAAVPILLYSLGYGISRDFKILKTGGIFIQASETGADIFIDSRHKRTSFLGKSGLIKNLVPGTYKVSVTKEGFWDWEKQLEVMSETVTARSALLVPKNPDGKILGTTTPPIKKNKPPYASIKKFWAIPKTEDFIILGDDKKFYRNKELFDIYKIFGTTTAEILRSKKESVFDETFSRVIYWDSGVIDTFWFEDAKKMPEWQKNPFLQVGPNNFMGPIRQVFSYPDWPDWLIATMSNGVWALEMDSSGRQNAFPLYQGKQPNIISLEPDEIIVLDDGNYLEITLPK
ncbi:hypothetical protein A3G55_03515 [Candidatus Giovannonibacteria bacterium RIFCSPLOWO2_12_FULL_44_25]|nr:MAG: hypothetical protein UW15_C0016G0012 [Parcubacteria group bacterium GW2011_GWC1_44_10]KKT59734.1 MAG: hypothetical protein UW53_C0008G0017 [Candidatus Giovannonibacteria bacterium GW2011_GWA1_44_25]KKU29612.1 MAG: hypothetical protein UX43_C0008G0017 [Candidatus Giovannonibacteria bacterium GW2011_GWB1_46_20]OGF60854.1 MAG: hypothetical protein A2656_03190 [Candidatus Giovannonibacteria bacterium RIFCSPHIGHO2_01_FULL_44_100]OGF93019.1 MAG: hypothetical protein A3G55_03515 [Candidatus Gi